MILDSFLRGLHSDRKLDLSAFYSLPTDEKDLKGNQVTLIYLNRTIWSTRLKTGVVPRL